MAERLGAGRSMLWLPLVIRVPKARQVGANVDCGQLRNSPRGVRTNSGSHDVGDSWAPCLSACLSSSRIAAKSQTTAVPSSDVEKR